MRLTRAGYIALGVALAAAAADQASKAWALRADLTGQIAGSFGPLHLTLVDNTGISYGLLQGGGDSVRWALALFACLVVFALCIWAARSERVVTGVALGLIIGGAIGNLIDRILRGAVVDFIDARALGFPWIFNPADSAITIGITLLLLESWIWPARTAPKVGGTAV